MVLFSYINWAELKEDISQACVQYLHLKMIRSKYYC